MAHTHEYDCIVCGAHFDSSQDLHKHNQEEHIKNATGTEVPRSSSEGSSESDKREEPAED